MLADPNDDAEVFSGPVRSNDYDYYGSFIPRPRVRILVVPVSRDDEDYSEYSDSRPSLFSILRSFLGARSNFRLSIVHMRLYRLLQGPTFHSK